MTNVTTMIWPTMTSAVVKDVIALDDEESLPPEVVVVEEPIE
jgi:hypothetical protein